MTGPQQHRRPRSSPEPDPRGRGPQAKNRPQPFGVFCSEEPTRASSSCRRSCAGSRGGAVAAEGGDGSLDLTRIGLPTPPRSPRLRVPNLFRSRPKRRTIEAKGRRPTSNPLVSPSREWRGGKLRCSRCPIASTVSGSMRQGMGPCSHKAGWGDLGTRSRARGHLVGAPHFAFSSGTSGPMLFPLTRQPTGDPCPEILET
jgi:hypothetical protein